MADIGDLRSWAPNGLDSVSSQLTDRAAELRGLSADLEATTQPAEWVGEAADAAYTRRGEIAEGLRRLLAQVQAVSTAAEEAGVSLLSVQESLRETDELAGRYWYQVGDDGAIRDIAPDDLNLDEHAAGDRERMGHELADRVGEVVRSAQKLDTQLCNVMNAAADNTIDDGTGTTLVGAAFAGAAFGSDTATLPPPDRGTPAANNAYWDALSDADRQDILDHHPEWVGNLDGIPASVRDEANRSRLPGELAEAEEELQWAADARARLGTGLSSDLQSDLVMSAYFEEALARRDSILAVQSTIGQEGRSLLVLDTSGEMVKAAVAIGDVDTADHVTVHVPGMTTTVDGSLDGKDRDMASLVEETNRQLTIAGRGDETVAAVAWIGYEAPQWSEFNDDQDYTDTVATDNTAQQAAPKLESFLNGIDASRTNDPHLTTNAHSYGTTTAGLALQRGTGVDDAVFYGSPGLGTDDVSTLGMPAGHVFVEEARIDPVADFASFGTDPNQMDGVRVLSTEAGVSPDGVARTASSGHSEYNVNRSMAQYNQAVIAAGLPEQTVAAPHQGGWGDAAREYVGAFIPRLPG